MKALRRFFGTLDRYLIYPDSVFALSVLLFLSSLALPVLVTDPLAHKYPEVCAANYGSPYNPGCTWGVVSHYFFGYTIFALGWLHVTSFQIAAFSWLANPLALLAILFAKRNLYQDAYITAIAAATVGLLALDYPSLILGVDQVSYTTAHLSAGYLVWEASLIVFFIYCRALYRDKRTTAYL